jgi:hypothetical protein
MTDELPTPPESEPGLPPTETETNPNDAISGKTAPLPVRIPAILLTRIDQECEQRGIARSELVRQILTRHYQTPGTNESVVAVLEQQKKHIEQLVSQVETLESENRAMKVANSVLKDQDRNKSQLVRAGINNVHDYVAELEHDLLTAVNLSCKSIMTTRSDFRRNTKHYGRLEAETTH